MRKTIRTRSTETEHPSLIGHAISSRNVLSKVHEASWVKTLNAKAVTVCEHSNVRLRPGWLVCLINPCFSS